MEIERLFEVFKRRHLSKKGRLLKMEIESEELEKAGFPTNFVRKGGS